MGLQLNAMFLALFVHFGEQSFVSWIHMLIQLHLLLLLALVSGNQAAHMDCHAKYFALFVCFTMKLLVMDVNVTCAVKSLEDLP